MALNHSDKGSVNYTIVGTPTIVDGVASEFSRTDYLQINNSFLESNSFDISIKFKTGETVHGDILTWQINNSVRSVVGFYLNNNSLFCITLMCDIVQFDTTIQPNTVYTARIVKENGVISFYFNGILFTTKTITSEEYTINFLRLGVRAVLTSSTTSFDGSIDLNETYIKVNGQSWFGVCPVEVKHIDYGTAVGYTIQGNATVTNGIATDFGYGSRLRFNQNTDYTSDGDWEFYFRFKIQSVLENKTRGIINNGRAPGTGLPMSILSTYGNTLVFSSGGGPIYPGTSLAVNTWFRTKVIIKNGNYIFDFYNDDGSLSAEKTGSMGSFSYTDIEFNIGETTLNLSEGSLQIDLNQSYIKKNGKLWFFRPSTNYLVKDDKLVFADSGLYLSGPVNYEVAYPQYGSPTIIDGIADGSTSAYAIYLKTSQNFSISSASNVEFYTRFKTISSLSASSGIFAIMNNGIDSGTGILRSFIYTYQDTFAVSWPGTSSSIITTYDLSPDTWYRGKMIINNGTLYAYIYDDNGSLLEQNSTSITFSEEQTNIELLRAVTATAKTHSIDLKETYIKVNGDLWFYGKNYASQNIAPVPAGLTYGNTTTSAIGWVDMRTQVFTAAPSGATLGKDEVSEES